MKETISLTTHFNWDETIMKQFGFQTKDTIELEGYKQVLLELVSLTYAWGGYNLKWLLDARIWWRRTFIEYWYFRVTIVPVARLSKAWETFRARKAIAKSRTFRLQSCFIHIFLNEQTFSSYKKFQAHTLRAVARKNLWPRQCPWKTYDRGNLSMVEFSS